jgi:hypothetical protein
MNFSMATQVWILFLNEYLSIECWEVSEEAFKDNMGRVVG